MMSLYAAVLSQPQALIGSVRTLCGDVSNAENLILSDTQRLFVSARHGVYELHKSSHGTCERKLIPVVVDGIPGNCMMNGITAHGQYLYLACAHVHQSDNPLVRAVLNDVNDVEQTTKGLLQLYMAAFTFRVESWIVRCDLTKTPLAFTDPVARLPGDVATIGRRAAHLTDTVLANGLTIDASGDFLYVANSAPGFAAGIYRVPSNPGKHSSPAMLWCRPPGCRPNGLKIKGDILYYTGNGTAAAVLGGVAINADGSAGDPQVIDTASLQIFDDFVTVEQGFLVAQFSDSMGLKTGSLRFVSRGGRQIGTLKRQEICKPCALAVAREDGALFTAGDVLIVDKHQGRVLVFTPDAAWRDGLRANPV